MATREFSCPSTRIPSDTEDGDIISEMNVDDDGQEDKFNVPLKRNDEDENLLNQYFEILNTMDEIDGDSYSQIIKLLHDNVT
ncbi:hypothetical protein FNV43_RR19546 [Rhamnella rubrinervis]|uniref:Uncharacterized protein n=1 Tax=Rhamnella rubrinervis TaxID=2594499 RepID=A0A8K0DX08_9ROSA|nr:hypothetical protein FNV43_RR19546 [Rhamnella rubrinervis]